MTPPEDLSRYRTGAESARPNTGEDLTALPTGAESASDTRGDPGWSSGSAVSASDFEIVRELGRGGMGVVHLARHRRVRSRWFAVKTLLPGKAADAGFLKRFHREAEVLRGLRHVHIVVIHGASRPGEAPLMILEFIPGPVPADPHRYPGWAVDWPAPPLNLDELVGRDGKLPPYRVADLGSKLANALQAVHDRGLVHRDVKPPNILIDAHGEPILADFGLARDVDPASMKLTGSMDNLGTVFYVAPEVKRDPASATPAADQFSLAVTLYAAATGDDPDVIRPEIIDHRLYAVLSRALNKNPVERYPSAGAFGQALAKLRSAGASVITGFDPTVATCPQCGMANKDTDALCARCGTGLAAQCLKCAAATPVCRPACVKCGAIQADAFDAIKNDADERFAVAAKARRELHFQSVSDALKPLVALTHPRLIAFSDRAKAELKTVHGEWSEWQKRIEAATAAAWPAYAAGRFAGLTNRFAHIPAVLWTRRMTLIVAEAKDGPAQQARATTELVTTLSAHAHPFIPVDAEATADAIGLRRQFKRYVKKIRHHSQDDLPEALTLTGAWMHYSRFVVLTTLYESRETHVHQRPHTGEPIPTRTAPPSELDPWGCRLPVPEGIRPGTVEYSIADSQRIIDCGACQTTGIVPCEECGGRKRAACTICSGTKMVECSNCRGKGREERTRQIPRFRDCKRCRGAGRVEDRRCGKCDGTGRSEYRDEEVYTVPCGTCTERGQVPCRGCEASGEVWCPTCRATGVVTCSTCAGKRQLVEVWVVKQTFWTADQNSAPTQPASMPSEVFATLQTDCDFAPAATVLSPDLTPYGTDLTAGPAELANIVRSLVTTPRAPDERSRLARQQVVVHTASVYQFTYRMRKKEYECWVSGDDRELFAPSNPVTEELKQNVREAIASASERAVALAVRDAREMGMDDALCALALEQIKKEVPRKVWILSKTVWSEEKRTVAIIGAGGVVGGTLLLLIGLIAHLIAPSLIGFLVALAGGGAIWYAIAKDR